MPIIGYHRHGFKIRKLREPMRIFREDRNHFLGDEGSLYRGVHSQETTQPTGPILSHDDNFIGTYNRMDHLSDNTSVYDRVVLRGRSQCPWQ